MSLHRRIFLDGSTSEKELKEELTRVLTADKCTYSYCMLVSDDCCYDNTGLVCVFATKYSTSMYDTSCSYLPLIAS